MHRLTDFDGSHFSRRSTFSVSSNTMNLEVMNIEYYWTHQTNSNMHGAIYLFDTVVKFV